MIFKFTNSNQPAPICKECGVVYEGEHDTRPEVPNATVYQWVHECSKIQEKQLEFI